MSRPCKLQINTTGAWRDLLRFDIDEVDGNEVQHAAQELINAANPKGRTTLRITMADSLQSVIAHWDAEKGWRPYDHRN